MRAHGLSVSAIARKANVSRSHLSQVLNGTRSGKPTKRKVRRAIGDEAWHLVATAFGMSA